MSALAWTTLAKSSDARGGGRGAGGGECVAKGRSALICGIAAVVPDHDEYRLRSCYRIAASRHCLAHGGRREREGNVVHATALTN